MGIKTYNLSDGITIDSEDMTQNHLICYVYSIKNCALQKYEINFKLDDLNLFMTMLEQYNVTKKDKQYVKLDDDLGEKFDFPHDEIIDEEKYYNLCQYGSSLDYPYHEMMMVKYVIYSDLYRILKDYLEFKQSISVEAIGAEENIHLEKITLALKNISDDKYTRYTIVHELFKVLTVIYQSKIDLFDIQILSGVDKRNEILGIRPIMENLSALLKLGKANAKVLKNSEVQILNNQFTK